MEKQNPEQTLICNARLANFGFTILTKKCTPTDRITSGNQFATLISNPPPRTMITLFLSLYPLGLCCHSRGFIDIKLDRILTRSRNFDIHQADLALHQKIKRQKQSQIMQIVCQMLRFVLLTEPEHQKKSVGVYFPIRRHTHMWPQLSRPSAPAVAPISLQNAL